jgi:adenine-specific DNA-methyltransferase
MEKLTLASKNVSKENLKKLFEIFPHCFFEVEIDGKNELKLDFDKLKNEISENLGNNKEKYQMTWPGKTESILMANAITTNTLRPKVSESKNFFETKNIYIEGNNLDVLKVIRETYLNKIDIIYIDPPYNTGTNILYKNNFYINKHNFELMNNDIDAEGNILSVNRRSEGRFHSKWLNIMYPLLKISRDLLSDSGLILIAIDDNEYANLKKICDEIFYENNYIGTIITRSNPQGRGKKNIDPIHEYHLVYSKQIESLDDMKISKKGFKGNEYWNFIRGGSNSRKHERPYRFYPMLVKDNKVYTISIDEYKKIYNDKSGFDEEHIKYLNNKYEKNGFKVVWPISANGEEKVWQRQFDRVIKEVDSYVFINNQIKYPVLEYSTPKSLWYDDIHSNVQYGTGYLNKLFEGKSVFDYPKSINTVKDLISVIDAEYVLDFFGGSATTADAVLRLNAEDSGDRKFIIVQLPEKLEENLELTGDSNTIKNAIDLCEKLKVDKNIAEIAKERIKRSGELIKKEFNLNDNFDSGFRVFKLDTSNMKDTHYNPTEINIELIKNTIDNIKNDRNTLDLIFQIMLNLGIELSSEIELSKINNNNVYKIKNLKLVVCLDEKIHENTITEISKLNSEFCVFKNSSFESDSDSINAEQIFKTNSPSTILKVI